MFQSGLHQLRLSLSDYRSLLPYAILGIVAGFLAAAVVLAFEYTAGLVGRLWLGDFSAESFEQLSPALRFLVPVGGALVLGLVMQQLKPELTRVGVVHVIGQLNNAHGRMPPGNALVQFFGGAIALATGQSGGREGPGVHLGAAINAYIGNYLELPNNSLRVLIACGTAAAIAAAFNTPIAGVIFAMEVIMAEYTVAGFIPVILAAVTATTLTRVLLGSGLLLSIPAIELTSLWELPFITVLGFVAGTAAAAFIVLMKYCMGFQQRPLWLRFTAAGLVTGTLAVFAPQIMGMGYDTLNLTLGGGIGLGLLLTIALAKLFATSISCGLGMPIGLIGPNLIIGACLGAAMGALGATVMPELASHPALYVLLGMCSTMAAILNAPLAALLAVVELSHNVGIIYPAMLAIITATLTVRVFYKQPAAHQMVLKHLQLRVRESPLNQLLQSTSVTAILDSSLQKLALQLDADTALALRDNPPNWCLLEIGTETGLIAGTTLADALQAAPDINDGVELANLDLPALKLHVLPMQATLREALDLLEQDDVDAIYVSGQYQSIGITISGVVTLAHIERFYRSRE
ncbi:MAG: CIC family chloride channel protein [Halieaceae bacterium]|jgi:CIC family chloride channel protein